VTAYTLAPLNVDGPNLRTVDFFASTGCKVYAELGVYRGDTAGRIADLLAGEGEVHLFDYEDRVFPVAEALARRGHRNVVAHPNTRRTLDSYNWSLMKLLRDAERPILDYVFIDGAHTWALDALAFLLVDRLLRPGGYVDFDDYAWTLARSPSMSPDAFPPTSLLYNEEQIEEAQVALVVDLLVRRDPRYEEVVPDKIFRKSAGR
jgi:predicted O-methyltransferase YrrM